MPSPQRQRRNGAAPPRARVRWLLAGGAVLVVVAALASSALTLSHALAPDVFAAMVGKGLDRSLSVERVRLELRPRPWVRAEGVEIEGLGSAEAAEVQIRLRPLLRGEIRAHRVRFEDPRLVLHRGPDGAFLPILGESAGGAGLGAPPRLEVEGGEVWIVQGERLTAIVRLRALSLGPFDARRSARLVATGDVAGGDGKWNVHPLSVAARMIRTPEGLALEDGDAQARQVAVKWWHGRDARARFFYRAGIVRIESLRVRAYDGSWRADGGWRLRGGMQLDLAVRAQGVDLAAVATAASPGSAPGDLGVLRMRWSQLRVPWHHGPRWESASGVGDLRVAGGVLPGHSILARAVGASVGPNAVSFLTAPVELEEGRLRSQEVRLESEDYVLSADGSLGIDTTLALDGRVRLAGTVLPPIPVTIAGRLMEPTVDAHPSRVPAAGVDALASGVHGALGAAGKKARDVLGRDG